MTRLKAESSVKAIAVTDAMDGVHNESGIAIPALAELATAEALRGL